MLRKFDARINLLEDNTGVQYLMKSCMSALAFASVLWNISFCCSVKILPKKEVKSSISNAFHRSSSTNSAKKTFVHPNLSIKGHIFKEIAAFAQTACYFSLTSTQSINHKEIFSTGGHWVSES